MACFIVPLVQAVATTVYRKRPSGIVFPTWRKCSGAAP